MVARKGDIRKEAKFSKTPTETRKRQVQHENANKELTKVSFVYIKIKSLKGQILTAFNILLEDSSIFAGH